MNDELDIVGLVRKLRKTNLLANSQLKDYQRFFISKSQLYHLSAED
jgi:hypothetical protein